MQLPHHYTPPLQPSLNLLPRGRLIEVQPAVRDVARCAGRVIFRAGGELAVGVVELAEEGGVGVVEDVEC